MGTTEANGGAGAYSYLANDVSGSTNGGKLSLTQDADGGAGGASYSGTPGAGGVATSNLTFNDTANAHQSATLSICWRPAARAATAISPPASRSATAARPATASVSAAGASGSITANAATSTEADITSHLVT